MNAIESAVQLPSRIEAWWREESGKPHSAPVLDRMGEAYRYFQQHGFPTTRLEDWKYTHVHKVIDFPYAWPAREDAQLDAAIFHTLPLAQVKDCYRLVFVNGYLNRELSWLPGREQAFTISSLGEASSANTYENHLGTMVSLETGFTALNTALHTDGVLIHIPKGVVVDKPVLIYYVAHTPDDLYLIQPRNIVVADDNSQVQLAEIFVSRGGEPALTNVVTEVKAGAGAYVDYSRIQLEESLHFHVGFAGIRQERDSRVDTHVLSLGGAFTRNNLHFSLQGQNCSSVMNGLYILDQDQFLDNHTRVDHAMPHCLSDQLYKGILDDQATAVFNGKIMVHKDAQKTNAYQRNTNVLLSSDATINTKPQLEIFADDVRCTHGATAGYLNEEAIFYLRSRGIAEPDARRLLMNAYAHEIVDKLNIESLKDPMKACIADKLR